MLTELKSSCFEFFGDEKCIFWAKKLMESWCLLVAENFLLWTFQRWEIRSFLSQEVDGKDHIYWLLKSFSFELFGGGKYGLVLTEDGIYCLLGSSCLEHFGNGKYDLLFSQKVDG